MKKLIFLGLLTAFLFLGTVKAACEGTSIACSTFNESVCSTQDSCLYVNITDAYCSGTGDCMVFSGDQPSCEAAGCSWGAPFCSGSFNCSIYSDQSNCENYGCSWTSIVPHCDGTHTTCSSLNDSVCPSNIGCFLSSSSSTCNSCNDCVFKLKASHNVTLTSNIYGQNDYYNAYGIGNCIFMDVSNTKLDCNEYKILGNNVSNVGILMYGEGGAANLFVDNCFVTGYTQGILTERMTNSYLVEDTIFCKNYNGQICSSYPIQTHLFYSGSANKTFSNVTVYGTTFWNRQANVIFDKCTFISSGYTFGYFEGNGEPMKILVRNSTINASTSQWVYGENQGSHPTANFTYNYWLNYNGTGFSDNCTDANEDDICDTNITFSATSSNEVFYDLYPLEYIAPPQQEEEQIPQFPSNPGSSGTQPVAKQIFPETTPAAETTGQAAGSQFGVLQPLIDAIYGFIHWITGGLV